MWIKPQQSEGSNGDAGVSAGGMNRPEVEKCHVEMRRGGRGRCKDDDVGRIRNDSTDQTRSHILFFFQQHNTSKTAVFEIPRKTEEMPPSKYLRIRDAITDYGKMAYHANGVCTSPTIRVYMCGIEKHSIVLS
jgi:hypothetical protein